MLLRLSARPRALRLPLLRPPRWRCPPDMARGIVELEKAGPVLKPHQECDRRCESLLLPALSQDTARVGAARTPPPPPVAVRPAAAPVIKAEDRGSSSSSPVGFKVASWFNTAKTCLDAFLQKQALQRSAVHLQVLPCHPVVPATWAAPSRNVCGCRAATSTPALMSTPAPPPTSPAATPGRS